MNMRSVLRCKAVAALCSIVGLISARPAQGGLVYYLPFQDGSNNATLTNFGSVGGTATTYGAKPGGFTNATPYFGGGAWGWNLLDDAGAQDSPALELPDSSSRFRMITSGDTITVAAWVKVNSIRSGYQGICSKNTGSVNSWFFGLWYGNLCFYDTSTYAWVDSGTPVTPGVWTHVAMTWQAGTGMTFYKDGASVYTANPATSTGGSSALHIGFYTTANNSQLNGLVDDYRIYDTVLTAAEIKALAVPSGMVYYLPFQTTNGTATATLTNFGTAGGAATLVGSATYATNVGLRPQGGALSLALTNSAASSQPYLALPNSEALFNMNNAGDKMTIVAWIKMGAAHPSSWRGIVSKTQNFSANGWTFAYYDGYGCYLRRNAAEINFALPALIDNYWNLLGLTWEAGSNLVAYLNGEIVYSNASVAAVTTANTLPLRVGTYANNGNDRLDGFMDEVRIYDTILSQAQIKALCTGLVHELRFQDAAGNATLQNTGLSEGSPLGVDHAWPTATNDTPPLVGGAYAYAFGTSNQVQVGDSLNLNLTSTDQAITVAAWIKIKAGGGANRGIACKKTTNYLSGPWLFCAYRYSDSNISLLMRRTLVEGSSLSWDETAARITADTWHHVAFTWQVGGELMIYVDGVGESFGSQPACAAAAPTWPIYAGTVNATSVTGGLDGLMDDFRIYNYVLTSNEVSALRFPPPQPPKGTLFYFR